MMEELSERQKVILTLVTHEHINTASPVGSKVLVEKFKIGLSPATVRNEMSYLTDLGYLQQPHTSAGRVPTEKGYRFFVGRLVNEREIPISSRRRISHQFFQMRNEVEQWAKLAASILADQSKAASLVTTPHPEHALLKHVEFISTVGRQILMVIVLSGGEIRQRIQSLSEPVGQERLTFASGVITKRFQGFETWKIKQSLSDLTDLELELASWLVEEMERADSIISGEIFFDGITNVLAEPEFTESGDARKTLKVLEERTMLYDLFSKTIMHGEEGTVQVLIGGEGPWEELREYSIVLSKYGAPGIAFGTVGVLGPMRMPYGKTISAVRFMSGLLSDLVSQSLYEDQKIPAHEVDL
jgi:heat-inducible transcriptional repressor